MSKIFRSTNSAIVAAVLSLALIAAVDARQYNDTASQPAAQGYDLPQPGRRDLPAPGYDRPLQDPQDAWGGYFGNPLDNPNDHGSNGG